MTIKGQVLDAINSTPVASCSVMVQGTSVGTIADSQGNFSLTDTSLDDPNSIIVFSDVSYVTYSTSPENAGGLIYMAENDNILSSVVVTAKRIVKKNGSVTTIVIGVVVLLLLLNYKKIIKWSSSLAVIILLLFSCSSVKKVNQDVKKQLAVIDNFQSSHPLKNDTTYINIPGDTVVNTLYNYDTINTVLPGQVSYRDRVITKTVTITKEITDTIVQKVTDRTLEYALQKIIEDKNATIDSQKLSIEQYKRARDRWFYLFIGLLSLNSLYVFLKIKKVI